MAITWKKLAYSGDPPTAHDLDSVLHTAAGGDVGKYINISGGSQVQYRTPAQVLSDINAISSAATHTKHFHIPVTKLAKGAAAPTEDVYGITKVFEMTVNTDQAYHTDIIAHEYAGGDILIHINWTRNNSGVGGAPENGKTVKWQIKNLAINGISENCNSGENTDSVQDVYDSSAISDQVVYETDNMTIAAAEVSLNDLIILEIMAVTVDSGVALANPAIVSVGFEFLSYKIAR